MKSCLLGIVTGVALLCLVTPTSWAQDIALGNTQALSFGSFVAGSGGSVTVSTLGSRTASGGVLLMPSSQGTAAQFTASGNPDSTYSIQLPGNNLITLIGPGNDMFINDFSSTPSGAGGQLGAGGSQVLSLGATLNVAGGQVPGNYSGAFSVIVNYN